MYEAIETAGGLLNVTELAAYLNVKPSWIYAQHAMGFIPCVRVGRYLRFDLAVILEWLKKNGR
ncbi:MAG: helix-turn-helix domain-containing protein [Coriobacteriia bacterium]|nr:helix-turn-helix domain-containing protein [Coriobacteriia bacterium]